MTGHEYMMQVRRIELRIRRISLQIEELESSLLPQGIRYDKDKVQTSPANQLEADALRLIDVREEYRQVLLEYAEVALTIERQVKQIEPDLYNRILHMRYIETDPGGYQMSLRRISWKLHKNYNYICNQHGAALIAFAEKFL